MRHWTTFRFKSGGGEFAEGSAIENKEMVELAATQLGQKPEVLTQALISKKMRSGKVSRLCAVVVVIAGGGWWVVGGWH